MHDFLFNAPAYENANAAFHIPTFHRNANLSQIHKYTKEKDDKTAQRKQITTHVFYLGMPQENGH